MSDGAPASETVAAAAGGVDRAIVLELLSESGDSDVRDMVAQLDEMAPDIDQITSSESARSRSSRGLRARLISSSPAICVSSGLGVRPAPRVT